METHKKHVTVAITGAAGQIGYALLFRIASGAMLGPDTEVSLRLIELEPALPALEGVMMELADGAFPLLRSVMATAHLETGMEGVNWALLVGAVPRKAGMERSDLLSINGGVFAEQGRALNAAAADDVRILVVGNPCNTNALIALHHAPRIPNDRFYAMTLLDEYRARAQLAIKAGVSVAGVQCMNIWGNHSATQYPDFHHALINGRPATEVITDEAWLPTTFLETVQKRGAAVIQARGASSAASAAHAAISTVYHLTHDTPEGEQFSVCVASQGQYGVDPGLVFSYPCRTEGGRLQVIEGIAHNDFSTAKLGATLAELRQERADVEAAGLLDSLTA